MYVTVVVPRLKGVPDALLGVRLVTVPQLSVAEGGVQLTTAVQSPGSVFTVMFDGQSVITGPSLSMTVTVKEHIDDLP